MYSWEVTDGNRIIVQITNLAISMTDFHVMNYHHIFQIIITNIQPNR